MLEVCSEDVVRFISEHIPKVNKQNCETEFSKVFHYQKLWQLLCVLLECLKWICVYVFITIVTKY